ncbi:MAG: hypothetical protein Q9198_010190 [Flavoplaca austrocitrina]
MIQITDEAAGALGGEGEGITPKVPLEGDDGERSHASPDHAEGGFSTSETGVEKTQTGAVPLIQILDGCRSSISTVHSRDICVWWWWLEQTSTVLAK